MRAIDAAPAPQSAHRFVWVVCLLWLVLALDHAVMIPEPLFPLDDAYIAMHNATALRTGDDPSFGGISSLHGATSLVHLLLVAAAQLVVPPAWASWAVTWLGILAFVAGVCRLARVARLPWYIASLLVALSLVAADSIFQLLNGIETGLAMAAVVWACALRLEPLERTTWTVPLLIGALPLIRPELALLGAGLWLERGLRAPPGRRTRQWLYDAARALVPLAPGLLAYQLATGAPFPQTLAVKRAFFALPCAGSQFQLNWFAGGMFDFATRANLTALGLFLLLVRPVQWSVLAFAAGLSAACLIAFPEGVGHNNYRYLYPLLPVCFAGFAHAWSLARAWRRHLLTGALAGALLAAFAGVPRSILLYLGDLNLTEQEIAPAAEFVRTQLPAAEPLLVHDIGFISTAVVQPLVDVVGLKDPRAASLHRSLTASKCEPDGRARVVAQLALERNARHFVVFTDWDQTFRFTPGLRELGWTLTPLRASSAVYQVYRLQPPGPAR